VTLWGRGGGVPTSMRCTLVTISRASAATAAASATTAGVPTSMRCTLVAISRARVVAAAVAVLLAPAATRAVIRGSNMSSNMSNMSNMSRNMSGPRRCTCVSDGFFRTHFSDTAARCNTLIVRCKCRRWSGVGRTGVQWGYEVAGERVDGGKRGGGCHALGGGGGGSLHRRLAGLIHRETLVVRIYVFFFVVRMHAFFFLEQGTVLEH
jgi:hypothetical protein